MRLENPEALVGSVLFLPRDLQESFFFPEGNIDHMELIGGQTFCPHVLSRTGRRVLSVWGACRRFRGAGSFRAVR